MIFNNFFMHQFIVLHVQLTDILWDIWKIEPAPSIKWPYLKNIKIYINLSKVNDEYTIQKLGM